MGLNMKHSGLDPKRVWGDLVCLTQSFNAALSASDQASIEGTATCVSPQDTSSVD